ncbi:fas apoptotic inhibitory molecule 3 isoform X1 [Myotis myotis]|uniref:Fc of IgM receptor n=1 Tax=Myotis myotis TaxID=51298 RepID=A0A7J7SQA1_MYOMY|nr:fas apoptotic inhibitory molecule 3 isoform X1 [Myotis myotis]KAF6290608.1 Fc fragment of IgM receptor [Myotis myotis]
MDPWLWLIYFLPTVSGALVLPEVKLEGMLGGSITIECPLPETYTRAYLCREIDKSQACFTVVSSMRFVRKEYKHRVTLKLYPDQNLFLVEVTELTQSDSGVYACGTGLNTDRGKSQKVTLDVHSDFRLLPEPTSAFLMPPAEYDPFWEEEPFPPWRVPPMEMLPWFQKPVLASSLEEVLSQVTSPAPRTEAPPAHPSSPTPPVTHRPRVSRSSAVVAAKLTTRLPSTTSSKTPAPERLLRPQTASYNQHTRLHRQRASHHSPASRMEDQGFHLLIPTFLSLILLTLLGLLVTRIIQRKKALSRRASRLALRMSALAASQRPQAQRPRVSPRPRSQNNVYSACPRRDRGAHAAGDLEAPIPRPGASAPPAPPQVRPAPAQVSEAPWPHVPSLKTSCEYMTVYHQPAAMMEDADSDEYVNIYCLTHPSSCPPGPRPLRQ